MTQKHSQKMGQELGHEVGAAEICRLMKRTKEQIPTVEKMFGLTHVLDEALK